MKKARRIYRFYLFIFCFLFFLMPLTAQTSEPQMSSAGADLLHSAASPWWSRFRIGGGFGAVVSLVSDLAPYIADAEQTIESLTIRPGISAAGLVDFRFWRGLSAGLRYNFSELFSPEIFIDRAVFHSFALESSWRLPIGIGSVEPFFSFGVQNVSITDVRFDVFTLAKGEGRDYNFSYPALASGLRVVGEASRYLDVYAEAAAQFLFAPDAVLPFLDFKLGLIFPLDALLPPPEQQQTKQVIIIEEVETEAAQLRLQPPLLAARLFFRPDSDEPLPESLQDFTETMRLLKILLGEKSPQVILTAYAFSFGNDSSLSELMQKRCAAAEALLRQMDFPIHSVEQRNGTLRPQDEVDRLEKGYQRRVDIYLTD